jgi:F0F1-type ATP synthase assembly protein I
MTMRRTARPTVAALLGGLALWLPAAAVYAFVDAVRGTTGDVAREVPLVFGVALPVVSLSIGYGPCLRQ